MKIRIRLVSTQVERIESMMRDTRSRVEAQRCRIVLLLAAGERPGAVMEKVGCVRSTVYTTLYRFEDEGIEGLLDKRLTREPRKATAPVRAQLLEYVERTPRDYGWQRTTWTLELLATQLEADLGVHLSESHLSTVLRQENCRRARPRPALRIPVRGRRTIEVDPGSWTVR